MTASVPGAAFATLPAAGRPKLRRRQWILLKDVQLRIIAHQGLASILCIGLMACFAFLPLINGMDSEDPVRAAESVDNLLALHVVFWPMAAAALAVLMLFTVYFSHRIVGPLYRLRVSMREVQRGHILSSIKLRDRDLLMEDGEVFNGMLAGLRERLDEIEAARSALAEEVQAMSAGAHDLDAASRDHLARLRERSADLDAAVARFDVAPGPGAVSVQDA